jgi:molybdenum cofactor cytidylyltransferase
MSHTGTLAAIILAAGSSSRLGRRKQLVELDGETLIARAVRLAVATGAEPVVAVLGDQMESIAAAIAHLPATVVSNNAWQTGMASSLRAGLRRLMAHHPVPQNVLVLVCDQPMLDSEVLQALVAKHFAGKSLVTAAGYAETAGVPAIFRSELYDELSALEGDRGARGVIQRHLDESSFIDFPGGALDIDKPEDLSQLPLAGMQRNKK